MKTALIGGLALAALLATRSAPAWEIPPTDRKTPATALAPVGLRLTGQVWQEGSPAWRFEIVMHGHDRYYRKAWGGPADGDHGWWSICLLADDFAGSRQMSWDHRSIRGVRRSGDRGKSRAEVARRLFAGDRLVGALRSGPQQGGEEFVGLCRRGNLLLPTVIRWLDREGTETVYHVQQIDVFFQYDKGFIDSLKKKYFR